jgi:peptidoglycan/xylan/chitin deacetylase (PgdA/CDA1 family)
VAGTAAAGWMLWAPPVWLFNLLPALFPGCLYRVQTAAPMVALTIDDGPDPSTTPLLGAELEQHQARATFFLISRKVVHHPGLVHRLVATGHEIGNHLTRDEPSIALSPGDFEQALREAHQTLTLFGRVKWARPGSGWYSRAMVAIMARNGYRCALGSVYPYDAAIPSVRFASSFILRNAGPGAVIVLHDGGHRGHRTLQVLRTVLPELRRRGLEVVTLSHLIDLAHSTLPPHHTW